MLRGFWKLTWVEVKVFVREPMGVIGTLVIPLVVYLLLGRRFLAAGPTALEASPFNVAVFAALFISVGAVLSLVAIIAIYREGGILKRLRATPLSPVTILGSHVIVKLAFTTASLGLLVLAGRRMFPGAMQVNIPSFIAAVLVGTASILSLGFVIASVIPTARFAQPIGAALLYPMVGISGLFIPVERMPGALRVIAAGLPTTHAVSLMQGVWNGDSWFAHLESIAALIVIASVCLALATRIFRWE